MKEENVEKAALGVVELAAKAAHEVNRAYCLALGDNSQLAWGDAPEWQRRSAIEGAKIISLFPDVSPREQHERWMDLKATEGWKYGSVKDVEKKEHPCFLPYGDLPPSQKAKDYLFGAAVRGVLGLDWPREG